jgi:hypothetical protein
MPASATYRIVVPLGDELTLFLALTATDSVFESRRGRETLAAR